MHSSHVVVRVSVAVLLSSFWLRVSVRGVLLVLAPEEPVPPVLEVPPKLPVRPLLPVGEYGNVDGASTR